MLTLDAGSGDEAQASESIEAQIDGEAITTGFNPQFLLDGLTVIDEDIVELAFTQSSKPVVISGSGDGDDKDDHVLPLPAHAAAPAVLSARRSSSPPGKSPMHIGLVGLGKMGGNMRTRLRNADHTVVGYDRNPDLADVGSLADMVAALPGPDGGPKVVWVMVPAGDPTRDTIKELGGLLGEGDLVVDGGNSKYTDDQANAAMLGEKGIGFVDCGVSGGVWGLENGYALMCGGSDEDVAKVQPAFDALRPDGDHGFVHAGKKPGAGHFAKMVHNGIEYAMMQAYAEGWELLDKVDLVDNVTEVFDSWRAGTVIRSWLLDLLVAALEEDTHLEKIRRLRRGLRRGPLDRRGRDRQRRTHARHRRLAVRTVHLAPGRQPGHEGDRRDAQPVRRPRDPDRGAGRRRRGTRQPGVIAPCTSRT